MSPVAAAGLPLLPSATVHHPLPCSPSAFKLQLDVWHVLGCCTPLCLHHAAVSCSPFKPLPEPTSAAPAYMKRFWRS